MSGFGYIYKTTNLINGKIYIGQHAGTISPSYLGSGVLLAKAVRKYGKENFKIEIMAFASDKVMLDALEIKHIREHREVFGNAFLYNVSDGGENAHWFGKKHTPEEIQKISAARKRYWLEKKQQGQCGPLKQKLISD